MKFKLTQITLLSYIIILIINICSSYQGETLNYYWEFNYEKVILYAGKFMLTTNEINYHYFIWLLTLTLSLLHISGSEFNYSKTSLIVTLGIVGVFTVIPEYTLYFCAGLTIIINKVISRVSIPMIRRFFIILFIMVQASLIPLILEKIVNIKLSRKNYKNAY